MRHPAYMSGVADVGDIMHFRMVGLFGGDAEDDAPDWLTGINSIPGSMMDNRWFWNEHVLTLYVGESIETPFRTITRIQ